MTIFITISRGSVARNLLQNTFFDLVKKHYKTVVLLTPCSEDPRFIREFKGDNVKIIHMPNPGHGFADWFVFALSKFLVYTSNTRVMSTYIESFNKSYAYIWYKNVKYLIIFLFFKPLSKIPAVRKLLQKIDYYFFETKRVARFRKEIQKYRPSLILVTNIMEESALLKAARKENVRTAGMVKSWDNFSKMYFRARADSLIVWSPFMMYQAETLQDYKSDAINIIGIPQFDCYVDQSRVLTREHFCNEMGLDPKKRIILFGSEGKYTPTDPDVVHVILDLIGEGKLVKDCQVLIRPHFGFRNDEKKFEPFFNVEDAVVDQMCDHSACFIDQWDYSKRHMNRLFNSIYHSDMVINTASTLTLDGVAVRKPIILINFDGYKKRPFHSSVRRWYLADYYKAILTFNAAPLVESKDELMDSINDALRDQNTLREERERLVANFCYKVDGRSGERLFECITKDDETARKH